MINENGRQFDEKLFTVSKDVEFCETDMAGIAHYSNAFRYVEYAETRFFQNGGMSICDPLYKWPILSTKCDFLRPMLFGDKIHIALNVARIGKKSITLNFLLYKESEDRTKEPVSKGQLTVICAQSSAKSKRIETVEVPGYFKDYLLEYLAEPARDMAPAN